MQFLITPKGLTDTLQHHNLSDITSKELSEITSELDELGEQYELKELNIGTGADYIQILVAINSLATLFLLGDRVDKGIKGWINLGKRLKSIFRKSEKIYLDEHTAQILCLEHVSQSEEIKSFEIIHKTSIYLVDLSKSFNDRKFADFISHPCAVYQFVINVNEIKTIIVNVVSDGTVQIIKEYDSFHNLPF